MKYQSRAHSVLVLAGFVVALLPATVGALLGSIAAIYALPILITTPLLLVLMTANLWGLVSGWRLFFFFKSGKNEPGAGCWIGLVIFMIAALGINIWVAKPKQIPYLPIAVALHWLWLYKKDFKLDWQRI